MVSLSIPPEVEIAANMAIELGYANRTTDLVPPFVQFVVERHPDFTADYNSSSHLQRHSTGVLERKLVDMLIRLVSFRCTQFNCQVSSQIMVLLGYDSYQIRSHRFRQKVENYLRKERKLGGGVPPSCRPVDKKQSPQMSYSSISSSLSQHGQVISKISSNNKEIDLRN